MPAPYRRDLACAIDFVSMMRQATGFELHPKSDGDFSTKPKDQPGGHRWRVLADPAGHPFCLTSSAA
ncbi:hypothetical protein [Actinokineospora sp.]|uniref:hypothetical protein n=1 Tax=Actinokineospora sp. TaxID=1872133 RepID=UPI003D6A80EF